MFLWYTYLDISGSTGRVRYYRGCKEIGINGFVSSLEQNFSFEIALIALVLAFSSKNVNMIKNTVKRIS